MTQDSHSEQAAQPKIAAERHWRLLLVAMLVTGATWLIAQWMTRPSAHQGKIVMVDPKARRIVIRELPQQHGPEGMTWSVQFKPDLDAAALNPGDLVEFSTGPDKQDWAVTRTKPKP